MKNWRVSAFSLEEWGVEFEDCQWTLLKFLKKSSGYYIIPCLGHTGLHLSIHSSTKDYRYPHVHFKSDKFGIHEDVEFDDKIFSPEYWQNRVECLISSFEVGWKTELSDNQVLVFPNLNKLVEETNNQHFFNLNSIIDGTFYITEEKKVPSLVNKLNCNSLIGITEKNQILLVDKEYPIRFESDKIFKTFLGSKDVLSASIESALNNVIYQLKDKFPTYSQKIIPDNILQKFKFIKRNKPKFQFIPY